MMSYSCSNPDNADPMVIINRPHGEVESFSMSSAVCGLAANAKPQAAKRSLAPGRAPGSAAPLRLLWLLQRVLLVRFFLRGRRGCFGRWLVTLVERDLLLELLQPVASV